ncbi:hypothetical protein [Streptomyces sp. SID3343]|uniref:hypothetical protein n=1 Tax=Streptomyces sp. SID3343 TaxID=2690260 RepID=UPI00136AE296|nr:hypothetical protein [Streptomyces sp. SID3343]MYV99529.1 hypothetical protein [Streptomyces sp. SID3343]
MPAESRRPQNEPLLTPRALIERAERHARDVIDWIGAPITESGASTEMMPCKGATASGPKSVFRAYNVRIPTQRHQAAFERVRDELTTRGFRITKYDVGPSVAEQAGTTGRLNAISGRDGYHLLLSSTWPAKEITIWVLSPCFLAAPTAVSRITAGPSANRTS